MTEKPDFIAKFTLEKRESIPVTFKISPQTANYNDLINKPKINHVELVGDKSTEDLHIDVDIEERIESHNLSNESHPDLRNLINTKQDTLISGENIKTINYESILGSGNINIQGGGGSKAYNSLDKVKPYLYYISYNNLDYNFAKNWFRGGNL